MNNPYYKVTKIDYISGEIEESNRVENLGEFSLKILFCSSTTLVIINLQFLHIPHLRVFLLGSSIVQNLY